MDYKNKECCSPKGVCRPDEVIKQPKITPVNPTTTKTLSMRNS